MQKTLQTAKTMKTFKELILKNFTQTQLEVLGTNAVEMEESLQSDHKAFAPDLTEEAFFTQELPYLQKFGETAFTAGYQSKKL